MDSSTSIAHMITQESFVLKIFFFCLMFPMPASMYFFFSLLVFKRNIFLRFCRFVHVDFFFKFIFIHIVRCYEVTGKQIMQVCNSLVGFHKKNTPSIFFLCFILRLRFVYSTTITHTHIRVKIYGCFIHTRWFLKLDRIGNRHKLTGNCAKIYYPCNTSNHHCRSM